MEEERIGEDRGGGGSRSHRDLPRWPAEVLAAGSTKKNVWKDFWFGFVVFVHAVFVFDCCWFHEGKDADAIRLFGCKVASIHLTAWMFYFCVPKDF